jgi:hypothetical protein
MTINATLFVQFFNFMVAYFLIKLILLKPAVAVVNEEDSYLEGLNKDLEGKKAAVEKKEQEKSNIIQKAQKKLKSSWPEFTTRLGGYFVETSKAPQLPEKEIKKLADSVSKAVSKRVLNV